MFRSKSNLLQQFYTAHSQPLQDTHKAHNHNHVLFFYKALKLYDVRLLL